jgi:hypothetical protein
MIKGETRISSNILIRKPPTENPLRDRDKDITTFKYILMKMGD